jgi:undecaprenyl diphosphate synthase
MPPLQHVAIIMDGNRRWARERGLPVVAGHKKVVEERIEELIEHAAELEIPFITFWAFSTENWEREQDEVGGIMNLFKWALQHRAQRLIDRWARLNMIGDLERFSQDLQNGFKKMMEKSKINDKITATFALNYGGQDEIIRGMQRLFREIQDSRFKIQDLTPQNFGQFLDTAGMPDPDMVIRTGGEQRMSGFMPWQGVYAEYCFTKTLMPDFGKANLDEAVEEFATRQRRRGR